MSDQERERHHDHVTRDEFEDAIAQLNERMDLLTTTVADLNAAIDQATADLTAAVTELQGELDNLAAQNPGVDLSGPVGKVQALDASIKGLSALKPAPPAPAAAEPTQPVYTFSGDPSTIDTNAWKPSGFETTETPPRPLYYFTADTAGSGQGGAAHGADAAWSVYTGAVQPVPAA